MLNEANTLETFDYGCDHITWLYIPKKFIEVSIKHCEKSLKHFDSWYDTLGFEQAEEHYTTNAAGLYDFSSAALSASFNFVSFERLELVILPAMLLLNGFGPVTILKARSGDLTESAELKLAHWIEPDITALPDLATVLPSSIRTLGIEVHALQWELLRCYLWRQLSLQSTSDALPNLQTVQIAYLVHAPRLRFSAKLQTYWKRRSGFNLDWAANGTPEAPHVSCEWCGETDGTSEGLKQ